MANIELNIVALGDFSSVNAQIKALQAQVASLNAGLGHSVISPQLSASLKTATNDFSNALTASSAFTKQQVQLTSETTKFGQALESGKLSLGQYYQIVTGKSGAATQSVKQLALEQTKLQNSVIMADPTKQGFYSVFTPTTIDAAANATKIAANEANIYAMAVNKGSQSLINFGKNTQWAGRQLTVGLGMPMILFGSQAVKSFNQVNTALTQLQKVYGEGLTPPSQNDINKISQDVLNLGRQLAATTGISQQFTVEVASSFAAMGKMGSQLTTATEQTVRLAKLGNLNQDVATRGVIALQNVYKLSTTQLGDAVNYFASIQKQTSLSMSDLIESESRVGPIIDQLGGSYRDTAVMILAMKEAGVPAAQSANALKSAFASIIAPTSAAQKEFKSFGINLNAIKNAGGPVQMIEKLQDSLKNLSPLVKEQLIEKLFGKYQFSRISALLENFNKVGSQTANAIKVAGASSSELANLANAEMKQATSSPSAQWQIALNTFKADLYPVGQMIMKIGTDVLKFANGVAKAFGSLPGPVKLVLAVLAGFVAISGPIIMLTGLLANFAGNVLKGVFNLKQLVTGGKTLGQLLTPELVAAQNASDLFSKGVLGDADAIKLLNEQIVILTNNLTSLVDKMGAGAGLPQITNGLKTNVGAVLKTEATIAEQMAIPGFADGGIIEGPGTGTSDSILARVSNGETILTAEQTKKYHPVVQAIVRNNLPGFAGGISLSHASMPFEPGSSQYESIRTKYPEMSEIESIPGAVKVLSNLVAELPQKLNTDFRSGKVDVSTESGRAMFSKQWESAGESKFATAAALGGINISPETSKALKDFELELKNRIISLKKSNIYDQDLANETRKLIAEQINAQTAAGEVARALHNASQQVGQVRFAAGKSFINEGLSSGKLSMISPYTGEVGTRAYLGSTPVGEVRSGSGKITGTNLNQLGGYQSLRASAVDAVNKIKKTMKEAAGIASPAKVFNEEVGKPIVEGIQQGVQETLPGFEDYVTTSMTGVADKLTANDRPWWMTGEQYANSIGKGITENSAAIVDAANVVADEATTSIGSRLKGAFSGTMGKTGGIGLAMMLPMLTGMLPKSVGGTNISGLTSVGTTAASAGLGVSMLGMGAAEGSTMAAISGLAMPIAGAVAAFGLLRLAIDSNAAANREAKNVMQETFGKSNVASQYFNLSSNNINQLDFSNLIAGVKSSTSSIQENKAAVDALTAAYQNATDQQTKDYLNKIKTSSSSDLQSMMKSRYSTDLAQGMTAAQALQDITAAMKAAGKDSLTRQGVISGIGAKSTDTAATGLQNALKIALAPYESAQKNVNKSTFTGGMPTKGGVTPKTFASNVKESSIQDIATELLNVATTTPANLKVITDSFKTTSGSFANSLVNSNEVFKALVSQVETSNPKMAEWMKQMNKSGASTATLAKAISLLNSNMISSPDDIKKMADAAKRSIADEIEFLFNSAKAQSKKLGGGSYTGDGSTTTSTTPTVFTGTTEEKQLEKLFQGNLTAQNAQLKIARDQLTVQNKISQEAKAQLQYQQQITGLQNDMKTAMISGNYLQAAAYKQQISSAKVDFNATSVSTKMQNQIDALQSNADQINQALSDLKDLIGQEGKIIPASILAAKKLKPVNAQTIVGDVAGGVPTVTTVINVTGQVTSTSTTSSHPGVKPTIQTKVNPQGHKIDTTRTTVRGVK